MIMIIRKSKMKIYIEKKAKKLYGEKLKSHKEEHARELINVKEVFQKEIKAITKERNDAVNKANDFYATFKDIPTRLLTAWRKITRFKQIESDSKIEQLQISSAIEQDLEKVQILKNQADIEISNLIAINKTIQIGMDSGSDENV